MKIQGLDSRLVSVPHRAGATGYLGGYVARESKERGHFVRAVVRCSRTTDDLQGAADEIVEAEITRPETLEQVCDGIDCVFSSVGITRQVRATR